METQRLLVWLAVVHDAANKLDATKVNMSIQTNCKVL
jgi:hypothetical protein